MTKIAQAHEAAIAAETRVEGVFMRVLDKLHAYNERLFALHAEIKSAQPVASGAVCLEMYPCGRGCSGCPHPRWVKYHWTEGTAGKSGALIATNLDAQDRDPILALPRKNPQSAELAGLVREAKIILADRSALLQAVKALNFTAKVK